MANDYASPAKGGLATVSAGGPRPGGTPAAAGVSSGAAAAGGPVAAAVPASMLAGIAGAAAVPLTTRLRRRVL